MDYQDIRTLKILEEIDQRKSLSQRYLAKRLNISLGLVNSFLKRLAQKGYFKVKSIPRNRFKYILTPKGAIEKTRLTYEYLQHSFQFYRDARQRIKEILKRLDQDGLNDIVFYGASDLAEIAYISLQETSLRLKAVVDDQKIGKMFLGFQIEDSGTLAAIAFDRILITSIKSQDKPIEKLLKNNIHKDKIITVT